MVRKWRRIGRLFWIAAIAIWPAALGPAARPSVAAGASPAEDLLARAAETRTAGCERFWARTWLRERIVCESDFDRYGLRLDDNWQQAPADRPVVVLVHGFNSSPRQNVAMITSLREAGLPCGTFAYPNDHNVLASAQLLSCDLRAFARLHPKRRIVLVCHSMGSLVARACIEDSLYDPGNVERLIMIAPPTHGTLIAHFAVGTDLWEHWLSRKDGGPWRRTRDAIVDGLGEAADDLCPDSEFLNDLNGRRRNPRVRYSILLGTGAHLQEAQLAWIRKSVCDGLEKVPGGQRSAERLQAILDDIDELVEGKGDGIVAVKRGRLDGVSDTLVLPFGHVAVTGEPTSDVLQIVQREVLTRVQ